MKKPNYRKVLTCIALLFVLAANCCTKPEPVILSFETVALDEVLPIGSYHGKEPDFLVLTQEGDIQDPGMGVKFEPVLSEKLHNLDFDKVFAIVLFRGEVTGTSQKYTIDVLQVTRTGNKVEIQAHLGNPELVDPIMPAQSSPYHIIAVAKDGDLVSVWLLWGCIPKGKELPFETIETDYSTFGKEAFGIRGPYFVVINKVEDAQILQKLVGPTTLETLQQLDYQEYFAVAIFQGIQGSTGFNVEIDKVVVSHNMIVVYANFITPDPKEPVGPLYTLPRQVIKVKKGDLQGKFKFRLMVNGGVIAQQEGMNLD